MHPAAFRIRARLLHFLERLPILFSSIRMVRDEWRFRNKKSVLTPFGFQFVGDPSTQKGLFEPEETAIIRSGLEVSDVFVDVGANIGYYTCHARSLGKHVLAFEPMEQNLKFLYKNLDQNGWNDIEVWPLGLSSAPGILDLYGETTGASLIEGWAGCSKKWKRTVPVNTLDNILGTRFLGQNLFIKIDVEGAELKVLEGTKLTLARIPEPTWLVEVCLTENHPDGINPDFEKVFQLFSSYGYETRTADRELKFIGLDDVRNWVKNRQKSFGNHNYLFTKRKTN